ncbi:hypothetical protein [Yoonia sp. 208BN28-4]|uniref:hypothetical protein n=1 Tax=Yoonia sp. 208BN28-4 TaxID=3126505 RepID=UPI0030B66D91
MTNGQKSPLTRGDIPADNGKKDGVPGAHGNEDKREHSGSTGASYTRRGPDRIEPSEDVDND